ncbi:hypothetical protein EMA8858_03943 [Emticicia aquatica]|uniref:Cyclophilin-like domain-containing protein n=1 Tax=Emticicia aquatica TaxID=1681835 RepID=A0ABN8F1U3_9BACT|nr:cyclophilin-like fold protein [Emticicia aquatica]CAH0997809.1 hypothetical protein EMA8858_03943 [Emticicia aquatica]
MVPFKTKVSSNEKQLSEQIIQKNTKNSNKLKIKIGEKTFSATLSDNPTAAAFKALLPLSLNMNELNNNEKFAQLPKSVPINASVPANIQAGDLMMYGSNTLVLFYKGFSTSYSYTKIGKIDDVTGLVNALGTGDIKVHFEIEKD